MQLVLGPHSNTPPRRATGVLGFAAKLAVGYLIATFFFLLSPEFSILSLTHPYLQNEFSDKSPSFQARSKWAPAVA